ncbi:hypothetical protein [Lentzea sp. NPDC003310]|uniref:hypothetical protein n=1 Tax=Lentzea sp. NPDC003310 TaxID=3154447 RepID=UPI0033A9EDD8
MYLDQWCFADKLVRDRAGQLNDGDAGSYKFLRSAALDGSVIFPLSQVHYRETWKRDHADAVWDTAVVMGELSGFQTFSFSGLAEWEALKAVAALVGSVREISTPEPIGWGLAHCLRGREGAAHLVDVRTGQPARWDDLPEKLRYTVANLERDAASLFELSMLARRAAPGLAVDLPMFAPVPDDAGTRFLGHEASIAAAITTSGRSAAKVRNMLTLLAYRDSWQLLASAALSLGLDPEVIVIDDITKVDALVKAMPIQQTFTALRTQTHLKGNWKGSPSDLLDFLALATVVPFADYYVADKKTYNLARDADLGQAEGCHIVHRLSDLCDLLRQRLS